MAHWISDLDTYDVPTDVTAELNRQIDKWGSQHHAPEWWLTILTEEVGEFAQAILDLRSIGEHWDSRVSLDGYRHMRDELVQIAAVSLAILGDLDGRRVETVGGVEYWPVVESPDPARWWEVPDHAVVV